MWLVCSGRGCGHGVTLGLFHGVCVAGFCATAAVDAASAAAVAATAIITDGVLLSMRRFVSSTWPLAQPVSHTTSQSSRTTISITSPSQDTLLPSIHSARFCFSFPFRCKMSAWVRSHIHFHFHCCSRFPLAVGHPGCVRAAPAAVRDHHEAGGAARTCLEQVSQGGGPAGTGAGLQPLPDV